MVESQPKQILLLAPDLLGQSLSLQLSSDNPYIQVACSSDTLKRHPSLIIWSLESLESTIFIKNELRHLKTRWSPAPILLLLPSKLNIDPTELLDFQCLGILQSPDMTTLNQAISVLLEGGRIVKLLDNIDPVKNRPNLLTLFPNRIYNQSANDIENELSVINLSLKFKSNNALSKIILKGRRRELESAYSFLRFLWSPFLSNTLSNHSSLLYQQQNISNVYSTDIVLKDTNNKTILNTLYAQLTQSLSTLLINNTSTTLAFEALTDTKQKQLLLSLLDQLTKALDKLLKYEYSQESDMVSIWNSYQSSIRKQTICNFINNYDLLSYKGKQTSITETLLPLLDFEQEDDELPHPMIMLDPLILNKPININGQLLTPGEPKALIRLKLLLSNWIIRNTEIISRELINACSLWPDLRNYLLKENLVPTRELERLRNHLNSQSRYNSLILKPIHLYESKRPFYSITNDKLIIRYITEPRDEELLKLSWIQKQVALLIEARDALAPQLQSLVKYLGNLMVIILTNIVGRGLGLIGKGIAQGMGRTITNK